MPVARASLVWFGTLLALGCAPSEPLTRLASERPATTTQALSFAEQQKLSGGDGYPFQRIGDSLAIDGDRALVGCTADLGSVYAFSRSGGVWSEDQKLSSGVTQGMPYYGASVALGGNRALIGAPHLQVGMNVLQGGAFVMEHNGSTWAQVDVLQASDVGADPFYFGDAVALRGTTAFVKGRQSPGAYYVFEHDGTRFRERQILTASDGAPLNPVIALDDTTAVIGSPYADDYRGAVYVFRRGATDWAEAQRLVA
ncbi:MAG TPA: hypothetical protein VF103_13380, partial [Polyangiaceae bacterium]